MLDRAKLLLWRRQYQSIRGQLDAVQAQRAVLQTAIRDASMEVARLEANHLSAMRPVVELDRFQVKAAELAARYAQLGDESAGILRMIERGTEYARNAGVLRDEDVDVLDGGSASPVLMGVL